MNGGRDDDNDGDRATVLLVDDDPGVLRDYAKMLRHLGFSARLATDGREAAERLYAEPFDVILSDISMPNMGGVEFLRSVRQKDLDVPVILMTGRPGLDTAIDAVEYGAFRYLTKPVELAKLGEVLRRAVALHRLAKLKREALVVLGADGRQLGDRAALDARFDEALERLWMAYQPIVDWRARAVVAYEALVRSAEPSLRNPADLLDAAERLGRVHDLGRRVRELVADAAAVAPAEAMLFINLHASDLNDPELYQPSTPLATIASRVVLEITERASLHGVDSLPTKVDRLRGLGFRIAVDDLGAGYAGLASFSQLEPEFVKLDMALVRDVDTSPRKRSVVRALAGLCANDLSIQLVSEGVETASERDALAMDGCTLLQGYLFAKPDRGFPAVRWA